ncbi:MAG TPA: hypothetical protein VGC93_07440 [Thermoanaerobaculia bacterium]|jgi:mono/diheme cytochrome c family protein
MPKRALGRLSAAAALILFGAGALRSFSVEPPEEVEPPEQAAPEAVAQAERVREEPWRPEIPRTWDEKAIATVELPLALGAKVEHLTAEEYYSIPPRVIARSYPVYHPDREPEGYLEKLEKIEPEIAFDPEKLATEEDWIAAGELVFTTPIAYDALVKVETVRDPAWYEKTGVPVANDGTVPFFRYFVLEKGKVRLGEFSCAACHTRVMDDGSVIRGAQGNFPLARLDALALKERLGQAEDPEKAVRDRVAGIARTWGVPWAGKMDPTARHAELTPEETYELEAAIPAGVQPRFGTSAFHPVQIPDLIGVADRRYLDRTGHAQHRSVGDLMRYGALQQGMAFLDRFTWGDGEGLDLRGERGIPPWMRRFTDEQLYALALFVYSLEPPPSPHPFDELAARGQKVFEREECNRCHTPPLYTSNKLTPALGYEPPADHPRAADIISRTVGTDPGLALYTRRGTGLYKVPSLKGVWYRGPFGHSGWAATLEDWLDPKRVEEGYVPTGFKPFGKPYAVKGHPFGLKLDAEERRALIAFLKTL